MTEPIKTSVTPSTIRADLFIVVMNAHDDLTAEPFALTRTDLQRLAAQIQRELGATQS